MQKLPQELECGTGSIYRTPLLSKSAFVLCLLVSSRECSRNLSIMASARAPVFELLMPATHLDKSLGNCLLGLQLVLVFTLLLDSLSDLCVRSNMENL